MQNQGLFENNKGPPAVVVVVFVREALTVCLLCSSHISKVGTTTTLLHLNIYTNRTAAAAILNGRTALINQRQPRNDSFGPTLGPSRPSFTARKMQQKLVIFQVRIVIISWTVAQMGRQPVKVKPHPPGAFFARKDGRLLTFSACSARNAFSLVCHCTRGGRAPRTLLPA